MNWGASVGVASITFSGAGVSVGSVTFSGGSSTQFIASVKVATDAVSGAQGITVVNPTGQQSTTQSSTMTVTRPDATVTRPTTSNDLIQVSGVNYSTTV